MNEGVLAAVIRLNEAETLLGIVPLYCAYSHDVTLGCEPKNATPRREIIVNFRFLGGRTSP
jgi:hypothetical protein